MSTSDVKDIGTLTMSFFSMAISFAAILPPDSAVIFPPSPPENDFELSLSEINSDWKSLIASNIHDLSTTGLKNVSSDSILTLVKLTLSPVLINTLPLFILEFIDSSLVILIIDWASSIDAPHDCITLFSTSDEVWFVVWLLS